MFGRWIVSLVSLFLTNKAVHLFIQRSLFDNFQYSNIAHARFSPISEISSFSIDSYLFRRAKYLSGYGYVMPKVASSVSPPMLKYGLIAISKPLCVIAGHTLMRERDRDKYSRSW